MSFEVRRLTMSDISEIVLEAPDLLQMFRENRFAAFCNAIRVEFFPTVSSIQTDIDSWKLSSFYSNLAVYTDLNGNTYEGRDGRGIP